ncbi:uncharacterized protein LOC114314155 [Camellia sinensis]|uniref:Uncharacterized protein n=1 Tax=Camellia sinensis var. sinensis TaxID=542762 RepID=A0A4S4D967_CAMSN|nr:uncharacterized protein LOC114314155 [Camellia sinensis]THF98563.1 hypothetical protein TEA_020106 [Camellia sinensis var. sinensis]
MIALHFPERPPGKGHRREMHRPQGGESESFVIQVRSDNSEEENNFKVPKTRVSFSRSPKLNFSAMKLFDRFRKIVMRLVFSIPSKGSSSQAAAGTSGPRRRSCDRPEPPKTSCSSSYYSSSSHYNEAIADCIEFFNKSSQEGVLFGRKSDVMV